MNFMKYKKNLQATTKTLDDPFFQVNWIYNHFNKNVPYISTPPTLKEYDLPENTEQLIKEEGKKIDLKFDLIELLLYIIGFALVASCFLRVPKFSDSIWQALLPTLGTYGWIAPVAFAIFFDGFDSNLRNRQKSSTPLHKKYTQFKDAQFAYAYWIKKTNLNFWMNLDGHQFEDSVAAVYRTNGYKAIVSKHGGDGGVDIILEKEGHRIAVQCKAHSAQIGPSVARDLYGTMNHLGISDGIIVSRSGFTSGVHSFVAGKPIRLVTLSDLLKMQKPNTPTAVPKQCNSPEAVVETSETCSNIPNSTSIHTESSFIQKITYKNNSLYLTFKTGSTYCYHNVSEAVYKEMLAAPSKGQFYHARIKDQYPYS